MNKLTRWINKATSPEGCTAVDARRSKKHNFDLAIEGEERRQLLKAIVEAAEKNEAIRQVNRADLRQPS